MDPSLPNTDNSQGGPETARNPYARGNSFDRPGVAKPIMSQPAQPIQPVEPAQQAESAQPTQPMQPIVPQQPVASGTGDIVLQPETPQKSKKPLILVILIILLLIGAFVAYFVATSNNNNSQISVSTDTKTSFNRYANYLLYGEDSDNALEGEYDGENSYTLYDKINSNDEQGFFEKTQSLLEEFGDGFHKTNSINEELQSLVDNYIGNFEIFKHHELNGDIDFNTLGKQYVDNGFESTKSWITSYYSDLVNSEYNNAKQYGENQTNYWKLTADLLQKADNNGCLQNGAFEADCLNNSVSEEANTELSKYKENILNSLNVAESSIVKNCWEISKMLNGSEQ